MTPKFNWNKDTIQERERLILETADIKYFCCCCRSQIFYGIEGKEQMQIRFKQKGNFCDWCVQLTNSVISHNMTQGEADRQMHLARSKNDITYKDTSSYEKPNTGKNYADYLSSSGIKFKKDEDYTDTSDEN
ncbi:MAG: hypothetical protein V4509_05240 [Patescibacteria group bacterium]